MRKMLKEYRIEIIALLLALMGVFLLVERFEIRKSVIEFSKWLIEATKNFALESRDKLIAYITSFTVSDFIGWILIILTAGFIIWRVRYRFLRSRLWCIESCPRCGGQIQRIHRTRLDRFLTWFLFPHGRRYRCKDCKWIGLRHQVHRKHGHLLE